MLFAIIASYLFGSIPTAVWIGKLFFNKDVRNYGSKNAGATNTFRVLGKKAGIPVLIIDVLKGWFPVFFFPQYIQASDIESLTQFQIILGFFALLGHVYPIFAKFKGGKGVATSLGVIIAMHPLAAALCFTIFCIVFLFSKYVSLGSIVAAIAFPVLVYVLKSPSQSLLYFSIILCLLVIFTHRANIKRLLKKEENKMRIFNSHN